ncbi:hypothetical protein PanWU01x14_371450 [Parasponia andersonii]|uniref:Uncharacterized protein n=1 Tax=Parasponia andersonii TaxID=3476 RepID=A0A2P5A3V3_PARAD|nr:hypothetical protein PanWU01x14_371450 [Parasponia andersonii]
MHRPTTDHWYTVKHLMHYLYGTFDHGIHLYHDSPMSLHTFFDIDWADSKDNFFSTSAYVVYLGRSSISWSSKKQYTIAHSSTEAEYRFVVATTTELTWVCSLLTLNSMLRYLNCP